MNYIDPLYDWEGYEASKIETVYPKPEVPQPAKPVAVSPEECKRLWSLIVQSSKN